ncbi:MAG: 4-alpha-glucanotransferase, partial [Pseudomonadota bacterium]|nr:4-alpha-glucanotransferase [Pseudomonadota bacterium]
MIMDSYPDLFSIRRAGVLLHPTALPGAWGVLGASARRFVDFLAASGMTVWQTLPLGPTHRDLSPYQSLSAHAGNPALIDLAELVDSGLLNERELTPRGSPDRIGLIALAAERFSMGEGGSGLDRRSYQQFRAENA